MVKYTFLLFLFFSINATADVAQLVDPTQPINYQRKAASVTQSKRAALPKLQSILGTGEQRKAILNNQLYTKNQRINGYRITQIGKDAVTLKYKSKTYRVKLYTSKERFIE